jgi:hypothetical protein
VDLAFSLVGQASKRGIIPRLPPAAQLIEAAEARIRSEHAEAVRWTRRTDDATTGSRLLVSLHPAAPELVLTAQDGGRVTATAVTSPVGPGYHTFACRLLRQLGEEIGIAWASPDAPEPSRDPTGHFASGDRHDAERGHLGWLGATLARAAAARRTAPPAIHLGTPAGVRYTVDAALATPLGPRDDEWLARAASAPTRGRRRLALVHRHDGRRYRLLRALSLMWLEVRWRRPVDNAERGTLEEALRLLHRAYPLDPSLPYPWREWLELAGLTGTSDPNATLVEERAAAVDPATPLVGYRRQQVTIAHEGWSLTVPGTFAERRTSEEWWGGEGGRRITLAAVPTGTSDGPMSADAFLGQVAGHLGEGALDHRAGEVVGRARMGTDDTSGITIGLVEGYVAVRGSGAAIRVEFADPADWHWALDQWRSLRPTRQTEEPP